MDKKKLRYSVLRIKDKYIMTEDDLRDGNNCFYGVFMDYDGNVTLAYDYPEDNTLAFEPLDTDVFEIVWDIV